MQETASSNGEAGLLYSLGNGARAQGDWDYKRATALLEEALALYRDLGDECGSAGTLDALGFLAWLQGDYAWATGLCDETLTLYRGLRNPAGSANTLKNLANVALARGDPVQTVALGEEALVLQCDIVRYRDMGGALFL